MEQQSQQQIKDKMQKGIWTTANVSIDAGEMVEISSTEHNFYICMCLKKDDPHPQDEANSYMDGDANSQAIISAISGTYLQNIDPTKVKEMYNLLEEIGREREDYISRNVGYYQNVINKLLQSAKLK